MKTRNNKSKGSHRRTKKRSSSKKSTKTSVLLPYFSKESQTYFENLLRNELQELLKIDKKVKTKSIVAFNTRFFKKWKSYAVNNANIQKLNKMKEVLGSLFSSKTQAYNGWETKAKTTKTFKQLEVHPGDVRTLCLNQVNFHVFPWSDRAIDNVNREYVSYDKDGCIENETFLNPRYSSHKSSQPKCISKKLMEEIKNEIKNENQKKAREEIESSRAPKINHMLMENCNKAFIEELKILEMREHVTFGTDLSIYDKHYLHDILIQYDNIYHDITDIIKRIQKRELSDYYEENKKFTDLEQIQFNYALSQTLPQLPWSTYIQEELYKLEYTKLEEMMKSFKV